MKLGELLGDKMLKKYFEVEVAGSPVRFKRSIHECEMIDKFADLDIPLADVDEVAKEIKYWIKFSGLCIIFAFCLILLLLPIIWTILKVWAVLKILFS